MDAWKRFCGPIAVEAKSVNHRFLEISLRLPGALYPLEMEYKKKIGERFKRGRIDVSIRLEGESADASNVNLNMDIARDYFNVLTRLRNEFDIQEPVGLKNLVGFRDIFTPPAEKQLDAAFLNQVEITLQEALSMLVNMSQDEISFVFGYADETSGHSGDDGGHRLQRAKFFWSIKNDFQRESRNWRRIRSGPCARPRKWRSWRTGVPKSCPHAEPHWSV